jgi:hypothetical protein
VIIEEEEPLMSERESEAIHEEKEDDVLSLRSSKSYDSEYFTNSVASSSKKYFIFNNSKRSTVSYAARLEIKINEEKDARIRLEKEIEQIKKISQDFINSRTKMGI